MLKVLGVAKTDVDVLDNDCVQAESNLHEGFERVWASRKTQPTLHNEKYHNHPSICADDEVKGDL